MQQDYQAFLSSASSEHWQKIGLHRRAGINVPLFSVYSSQSVGIGEIPDIQLLVDWCQQVGLSIIQLLPMNDVGFNFTPYDPQSTFALEPMYLRLDDLAGVDLNLFKADMNLLRESFLPNGQRVNYGIKKAKLDLLRKAFESIKYSLPEKFFLYQQSEIFWLKDYAVFKVLKDRYPEGTWQEWDACYRDRDPEALREVEDKEADSLLFYQWLQWQLFEQMQKAKAYATKRGVLLMGDLPFLVSRDSADVWECQGYFKLEFAAGAPPDSYTENGQCWGMPPYNWEKIKEHDYDYLIQKMQYGNHFYDLLRIDHVVGMFRLWTIELGKPDGRDGTFDPLDEKEWEEHGRKLLQVTLESSPMLPCAEDLGVVPDCSFKVLKEFSIPGMDIQRWARAWDEDQRFLEPTDYRPCSITMISTHDMSHFLSWCCCELGIMPDASYQEICFRYDLDYKNTVEQLFDVTMAGFYRWRFQTLSPDKITEIVQKPVGDLPELLKHFLEAKKEYELFLGFLGLDLTVSHTARDMLRKALLKASQSRSVFAIQFIQDWLGLADYFADDPWHARMNIPGTNNEMNWSLVMPLSLDQMLKMEENHAIREINKLGDRLCDDKKAAARH